MSDNCDGVSEKDYSVGRVVVDESLHTQSADETFFRYFGNDAVYSIRRTIDERDRAGLDEAIAACEDGSVRRTVLRMKGVSGENRWVAALVKRIPSAEGEDKLYSLTLRDVFSLERLSYARQKKISDYRYILSLANDLAFDYSFETGRIRIFMFDCCRENVLADEELEKWRADSINAGYVLPRSVETFNALCDDIRGGVYRFDYELECSIFTSGDVRELCLFRGLTRCDDPDSRRVNGVISVVGSNRRGKDANLAIEANRDSLSGLLNKRAVTSYATELILSKPQRRINLVILDVDNFAEINGGYGRLFGDEVVFSVAGVIKRALGSGGVAGRISGSSFLAVIENAADEEELRGVLRAIRTNAEALFSDRADGFRLTCSMGASTYPADGSDYDELFMKADKALYIAEQKGGNRYVIYDAEKHGAVEKDEKNKIVFLGSKGKISERLNFMGVLCEGLALGRLPDMAVLLEQIRGKFGIDDICVYAGADAGLILSCGNAQSKSAPYLFRNGYTERFSADKVFVVDNVNELEGRDDEALAELTAQNIGGAVQYLMTDEGVVKGMISFCYVGRFKKWSDSDINYLAIIGRTIAVLLKKNAYI